MHDVGVVMSKARVTPSSKKAVEKRRSTQRTELRGLLILSRLVTTLLKSLTNKPKQIHIFGNSQTVIGTMDATDCVLDIWYRNRVDEICSAMELWQSMGVKVNGIEDWPGETNIADL